MAEKKYIEREAALKVLCDACGNAACPKSLIPRCSYYEKMQSIPAADVRPVVPKWIPVTERLPEYGKHVLVYSGFFQPYIEEAYYCEDRKWRFTYDDAEVIGASHWMPLPKPPEEE